MGAKKLALDTDDVYQAKFAFCALIDEIVLMSKMGICDDWERSPLQLEMFGEHMAGERFFDVLEKLRGEGVRRVQVLEVFHMCLLLGFQGRYILEGAEKLGYLTSRLGDEIIHLQGKRSPFAPHWAPPDHIAHKLRSEVPLWVLGEQMTVSLKRVDGRYAPWHGYVIQAAQLGSDGGRVRYRLTMGPWLDWLFARIDSYVYQDKTAVEIVEEVFADYPAAQWRLALGEATLAALRKRSLCIQYGESDLAFVTRLLTRNGCTTW